MLKRFLAERSGVTSVEYAMIAGFMSLAIVVGLRATGTNLNAKFFGPLMNGFR